MRRTPTTVSRLLQVSTAPSNGGHLAARLGFWLKYWLRDSWHDDAELSKSEGDAGDTPLPRRSTEQLDQVCLSFKEAVGLGFDSFHPRWLLYFPAHWRERYIDILMQWEKEAVEPKEWLHMFVLLDRPNGGDRTIGLSVAPLRIWSKIRRPLASGWEKDHSDEFFFGTIGRPCEKAAWSLSVHSGAAQELGGAGAAFFLDLEKL